jgi:hypothetical protein
LNDRIYYRRSRTLEQRVRLASSEYARLSARDEFDAAGSAMFASVISVFLLYVALWIPLVVMPCCWLYAGVRATIGGYWVIEAKRRALKEKNGDVQPTAPITA